MDLIICSVCLTLLWPAINLAEKLSIKIKREVKIAKLYSEIHKIQMS